MSAQRRRRDWMVVLFVAGMLIFNYPLLDLVNSTRTLAGIPLLYFYLFAAWFLLIAAAAWITWHYRTLAADDASSNSSNSDEHA